MQVVVIKMFISFLWVGGYLKYQRLTRSLVEWCYLVGGQLEDFLVFRYPAQKWDAMVKKVISKTIIPTAVNFVLRRSLDLVPF